MKKVKTGLITALLLCVVGLTIDRFIGLQLIATHGMVTETIKMAMIMETITFTTVILAAIYSVLSLFNAD